MEGDIAGGRELLGPGADPPEMTGIADGGEGEAEFCRALGGKRHSLAADHLAVAEAAVEEEGGAAVVDHRKMPVGEDLPGLHPVDVFPDADDAVGIVADEVRLDEMVGDDGRLGGVGPRGAKDAGADPGEFAGGYANETGILHSRFAGHYPISSLRKRAGV